jgi:hypothetical protein
MDFVNSRSTDTPSEPITLVSVTIHRQNLIRILFITLIFIEIGSVLLDYWFSYHRGMSYTPVRRFFDITREDSLQNWFASTQALVVGLILWVIAYAHKVSADIKENKKVMLWMVLAIFFTYIGIDDAIKIHEGMGSLFRLTTENWVNVSSYFPSYAWQVVFAPIFVPMGVFILWFMSRELRAGFWLVLVALSCWSVAVGLDFLEGLEKSPYGPIAEFLSMQSNAIDHYFMSLEEFLEMLGTSCFLIVFLYKLLHDFPQWKISAIDNTH